MPWRSAPTALDWPRRASITAFASGRSRRTAKEGENPLLASQFAHETPVLRLAWSADGRTLASAGEDRLVKIWNADTMAIRQTLEKQSDWASGLAISADGRTLVVGRIDGTSAFIRSLQPPQRKRTAARHRWPKCRRKSITARSRRWTNCRKSPRSSRTTNRSKPPRFRRQASPPVASSAAARQSRRHDLFRFDAKAGDQWIIETKAARANSPLDTKIEMLDSRGQPVPRLLLRAVRDSRHRVSRHEQRAARRAAGELGGNAAQRIRLSQRRRRSSSSSSAAGRMRMPSSIPKTATASPISKPPAEPTRLASRATSSCPTRSVPSCPTTACRYSRCFTKTTTSRSGSSARTRG